MITLDYPITLEVGRYDPATNEEWFVGQFEVIAHLEEGIGRGWALDGFSYQASKWDHSPPHMRIKETLIRANGTRLVDEFVEREIKNDLARNRCHVDEAWDEAWAKQTMPESIYAPHLRKEAAK